MTDTSRSSINIAIRRSSKTPAIFLVGSFTEPAWEPVELNVKPLPPSADQDSAAQANGDVPDTQYEFSKSFDVATGQHQYKFRLGPDGAWFCDKDATTVVDDNGFENNVVAVEAVSIIQKPNNSAEKDDSDPKNVSSETTVQDQEEKVDGAKDGDGEATKIEIVSDAKETNDVPAEPLADGDDVEKAAKGIKDDDVPVQSVENWKSAADTAKVDSIPADSTIKSEASTDDILPEVAPPTEYTAAEVLVGEDPQTAAVTQDASIVADTVVDEKLGEVADVSEAKDIKSEPAKIPVEALTDLIHRPAAAKEEPPAEKEAGETKEEDDTAQATEPAAKTDILTTHTDLKGEPLETATIGTEDAARNDNEPTAEAVEALKPIKQETKVEPLALTEEEGVTAAKTEKPVEPVVKEPAKADSKPGEAAAGNEHQEVEQKAIEQRHFHEDILAGDAPEAALAPPAPPKQLKQTPVPAAGDPTEIPAVDTPAEPEPTQSHDVGAEQTTVVNGDIKKGYEVDEEAEEVAEAPADQLLETTTKSDELQTAREPEPKAPAETPVPESEPFAVNDDTAVRDVVKDTDAKLQATPADKDEAELKDEPAVKVATTAKVDDDDVIQPAEASSEPEQQKIEVPLTEEPQLDEVAVVAAGGLEEPELEPEPDVAKPVEDVAPVEGGAEAEPAEPAARDGTADVSDVELVSVEKHAAPDLGISDSSPAAEATSAALDGPEVAEPASSKSDKAVAELETESIPEQVISSKPTELDVSQPGRDVVPGPKAVPEVEAIDTLRASATIVDEPEASQHVKDLSADQAAPGLPAEVAVGPSFATTDAESFTNGQPEATKPVELSVPEPEFDPENAVATPDVLKTRDEPKEPETAVIAVTAGIPEAPESKELKTSKFADIPFYVPATDATSDATEVSESQRASEVAVEPEASHAAEQPGLSESSGELVAPADEKLKGSKAINDVLESDALESDEVEEVTRAADPIETVTTVEEPDASKYSKAAVSDVVPEPTHKNAPEIPVAPAPVEEPEQKAADTPAPTKERESSTHVAEPEVPKTFDAEPRVEGVVPVQDSTPEPAAAVADECVSEETTPEPVPVVAEVPEMSALPDEPEVGPAEVVAALIEPKKAKKPAEPATEVHMEPDHAKSEPADIEESTTDSTTTVEQPKEAAAPAGIAGAAETPVEQPVTKQEVKPLLNKPASEKEPEVVSETAAPVDVVEPTHDASATKNLEISARNVEDALASPIEASVPEQSSAEILSKEADPVLEPKAESPASDPKEIAAHEVAKEKLDDAVASKTIAVEIVQPASFNVSDYPLVETPADAAKTEPTAVDADTQEPSKDDPVEAVEDPIVETNGTTSKVLKEDAPQEPIKEPEVVKEIEHDGYLNPVAVAGTGVAVATAAAAIAVVSSDQKSEPSIDKSNAPTEVSSATAPESSKDANTPKEDSKADKSVVNGHKSVLPLEEIKVDATGTLAATEKTQQNKPPVRATETVQPPKPSTAQIPTSGIPAEPESTTKSAQPSEAAAGTTNPTPTPGVADDARPQTGTGDRSITSVTIHKRVNFFKALWHAIFGTFFGGILSVFRRTPRDKPRR
ncbi:hypothetical protein PAAG_06550 [Paracoccidioides lutzii Pb01]|uniref:AMP-activated protein kinase glycogen-binding domain-containing protein n=1 Tax=Paracoccidioides lutzii (strain ATCC MYA-826 / Pb01) TaxID=502779 RepID=C1H709_PARBA|nr:hypothetical protein PAAG_06550 [Paracoccidioides lutzii Pb01]EEH35503.2 hypothetical protein PAAG_06550 [Paracoccidioides lutzii Pb01]